MPVRTADRSVASMQTIERASMVLSALSEGPSAGVRLSDVADAVGLGKTTVSRLLRALIDVGYVDMDPEARHYRLGYQLFNLGNAARRFHVIDLARPGLARQAARTGDTVFLSLRDGDQALCVDRQTGDFPIRTLTLTVGDRRPLGVGAGALALLAFEPKAEIDRILEANRDARQGFDAYDDDALRIMIEQARAQGFSFNDGRIVSAMNAVGVPVFDRGGRVVAALSIAAIRERMAPPRLEELIALLKAEASELGQLLDDLRDRTAEVRPQFKGGERRAGQ